MSSTLELPSYSLRLVAQQQQQQHQAKINYFIVPYHSRTHIVDAGGEPQQK